MDARERAALDAHITREPETCDGPDNFDYDNCEGCEEYDNCMDEHENGGHDCNDCDNFEECHGPRR